MLELYFWTTPNGYKPLLFLEEAGLPYRIKPVNISKGEQFGPDFLRVSPNNRIPALLDTAPAEGNEITLFESGAILLYLAEKTGQFIPGNLRGRADVLQWLFWQMGGLGPMAGQNFHFTHYAPEDIAYAKDRYQAETARLFQVMETQLGDREFLAGGYSIADMACYPWVLKYDLLKIDLAEYPNLERWYTQISERPATVRAYEKGIAINTVPTVNAESKKILLGKNARTVAA